MKLELQHVLHYPTSNQCALNSLWCFFFYRIMAVPATVIYFTCYDQLRNLMRSYLGYDGSFIPVIAGASARGNFRTHFFIPFSLPSLLCPPPIFLPLALHFIPPLLSLSNTVLSPFHL